MTRTKALVNKLLMSNLQWKCNLEHKARTIEIVILNTECKDCKYKNLYTKNFTYTKKFYVHEIAAVNLSKIYFLKNAKKTSKPNNRDLNRERIIKWFNKYNLFLNILDTKTRLINPNHMRQLKTRSNTWGNSKCF